MDKRYQVFVSSTFEDLQDERKEVIQALLELQCIPCGMELFPAANDDQWTLIKKVIDDCDYYLLIIGGRYGSTDKDDMGYTEKEYRYALEKGKPIIAFLHKNPGDIAASKSETTEASKAKLKAFKELVQQKMVKYWTSAENLGGLVSRSVINLKNDCPAIGWVKADNVVGEDTLQEILDLKKQNEELISQISDFSTKAPSGTDHLAQGDTPETLNLVISASRYNGLFEENHTLGTKVCYTWNELFNAIAPYLINECVESDIKEHLENYLMIKEDENVRTLFPEYSSFLNFSLNDNEFQTIKIQFRALGLICQSKKTRSLKDTGTYWTLTPYGDYVMTQLRAIKKAQ